MKISIFLFFFLLISFIYSQPMTYEFIMNQNTTFYKTLSDIDLIYYIDQISLDSGNQSIANFCSFDQSKYRFSYYDQVFDQTDESIYTNEHYMLGIDTFFYVFLKTGILQVFNITFDVKAANLFHLNEIYLKDDEILSEVNMNQYIGMFYCKSMNKMLILSKKALIAVNLDIDNKPFWFSYTIYRFQQISTIAYARVMDKCLYILRKNSSFEIWDIQEDASLIYRKSVNFSMEFPDLFKDLQLNIIDFEINEEFFSFLEKTSRRLCILSFDSSFTALSDHLLQVIDFGTNPLYIELISEGLFILTENHENLLLTQYNKNFDTPIGLYDIGRDYMDLYIGDDYFIATYPEFVVLMPHSFQGKTGINQQLQGKYIVRNINYVNPFILNSDIDKGLMPFIALKNTILQLLRIEFTPPALVCDLYNVPTGDYALSTTFFLLPCSDVNYQCNRSNYYPRNHLLKIKVISDQQVYNISEFLSNNGPYIQEQITIFKENNTIIIILLVFLIVAILLIVFCVIYVYKLKKQQGGIIIKKSSYTERVMSKEQIDQIEFIKGGGNQNTQHDHDQDKHTEKSLVGSPDTQYGIIQNSSKI